MEAIERTPAEWLPILAKRMDDRAPRISLLRSYTNGTSPVPEMNQKNQAQWQKFQGRARVLFGRTAVEACATRMQPSGFIISGLESTPEETAASTAQLQTIWRDNRLAVQIADAIFAMLTTSVSYLLVGQAENGSAVITAEEPEFVYAAVDPLQPWAARAAIKVWRDLDASSDFAYVWTSGLRQKFMRPAESPDGTKFTKVSGGWTPIEEPVLSSPRPPIFILENKDAVGEFENHISTLDRIMLGILWRLVISAYQAFRQRAFKGNLPVRDSEGKEIPYDEILEAAPGANWQLPEGIDIWESAPTDILQLLSASKDDIREFAANTNTPLPVLMPDAANQSSEGALASREGVILKARDRINRIIAPISVALAEALRIEEPGFAGTVEVKFGPPHLSSPNEKYAAAAQAQSVGIPFRTMATDILGYSMPEVDAMELEIAQQQLQLVSMVSPIEGEGDGAKIMSVEDVKSRTESLSALIRAGVKPDSAATAVGLEGLEFLAGATPVTLKFEEEGGVANDANSSSSSSSSD